MGRSGVITLLILVLLVLGAFLYLSQVKEGNQQEALETSQAGSALSETASYTDAEGNSIELSKYLGEPMVAVTWASWCPDCVEQLQLLAGIVNDYQDVNVVAFNRGEPASTVRDFSSFYKLDSSLEVVLDANDHFYTSVGGQVVPEIIIFDSNGNIYKHYRNLTTDSVIRADLNELQKKIAED